jgi:hypothetical protein
MDENSNQVQSPPGMIEVDVALTSERLIGAVETLLRVALSECDMPEMFLEAMDLIAELGHFAKKYRKNTVKLHVEKGELSFVRIEMSYDGPDLPEALCTLIESLTRGDWSREHLNTGRVVRATVHLDSGQHTKAH